MDLKMLAIHFAEWKQMAEQAPTKGVQLAMTGAVLARELAAALRQEVSGEIRRCLSYLNKFDPAEAERAMPAENGRRGRSGRRGRTQQAPNLTWADAIDYLVQSFDHQLRMVEARQQLSETDCREQPPKKFREGIEFVDPCLAHERIVALLGVHHHPQHASLSIPIDEFLDLVGLTVGLTCIDSDLAGPFPRELRYAKARQLEFAVREFAGHNDGNLENLDADELEEVWILLLSLVREIYLDGCGNPDQRLVRFLAPRFLDALDRTFRDNPTDIGGAMWALRMLNVAEGPFERVPDYLAVWTPRISRLWADLSGCQSWPWTTLMWIEARLGRREKAEHARCQVLGLAKQAKTPSLQYRRVQMADGIVPPSSDFVGDAEYKAWLDLNELLESDQ